MDGGGGVAVGLHFNSGRARGQGGTGRTGCSESCFCGRALAYFRHLLGAGARSQLVQHWMIT